MALCRHVLLNPLDEFLSYPKVPFVYFYQLSFDGNTYQNIADSNYEHRGNPLGIYRGKAFITGCGYWRCARYTEILDMNTMIWSKGEHFPYAE